MTNVAVLRTTFAGTSWKCEFAECLTRLRPDLNPDAADEISDAMFRRGVSLTAAEAAHRWVSMHTPGQSGTNRINAP
jgi:hypothetical protein